MIATTTDDNAPVHFARYRFRYECDVDLARLILLVRDQTGPKPCFRVLEVKRAEVLIETELTLQAVKALMNSIDDGHVMAQTIHFADRYTGKRTSCGHYVGQPECDD
jgi:hypothetical protein